MKRLRREKKEINIETIEGNVGNTGSKIAQAFYCKSILNKKVLTIPRNRNFQTVQTICTYASESRFAYPISISRDFPRCNKDD